MNKIDSKAPLEVTEEHIKKAEDAFSKGGDKFNAKELIEYVTGIEGIDARSKFGKELMLRLDEIGINPRRSHQYIPQRLHELTAEDQAFIRNNSNRLSWMECAKNLFGDKVQPLSMQGRATKAFYDAIPPENRFQSENDLTGKKYLPPKNVDRILHRTNKYITPLIDKDKMTNSQKLDLQALMRYMCTNRFVYQINAYKTIEERDFFEGLFVRYAHNKPDLTEEEVDQYILLCIEVLIGTKNRETYSSLQKLLDDTIQSGDDNASKIRMGLVESINSYEGEYDKCVKRQNLFKKDLQGRRADRINQKKENHGSWLPIIEAFKIEDTRKKMVDLAAKRKERLKDSFHEYADMDAFKAEIYGITEEEIING